MLVPSLPLPSDCLVVEYLWLVAFGIHVSDARRLNVGALVDLFVVCVVCFLFLCRHHIDDGIYRMDLPPCPEE